MIVIELNDMEGTLVRIEKALEDFSETVEASQLYKANFVCEEILTNLLRHAKFNHNETEVTLSLQESQDKELLLTFKDNSEPFNLLDFPDPDLDKALEETELGGLGIFLTKQYAKKLEYRYENGYNILEVLL